MTTAEPLAAPPPRQHVLAFGDFEFDRENGLLSRQGEELPLPPRALGVLALLLEEPGRLVTKQALLDSVWNGAHVAETSLSEAVRLLRQALGDDPQHSLYIQTVHRRGYRFIAPVHERHDAALPVPVAVAENEPAAPALRPLRSRAVLALAAVAIVAVAIAAAVVAFRPRGAPAPPPRVVRFTIVPPPQTELVYKVPTLAVSEDGRHLVYTIRRGSETTLVHRDLSTFTDRNISGTKGALAPFFSPDGRRVGFYSNGQLFAVPLGGGTPLPLAKISSGEFVGAAWADDESVVFSAGTPGRLYRARPGGAVERLTSLDPGRGELFGHWSPRIVPGSDAVLFTSWSNTLTDARVEWMSLATRERRTLLRGASYCDAARGRLLCVREGGSIIAAPFDARAGRLTGPAVPVLRDVAAYPWIGFAHLAVGGDTLIYLPGAEHVQVRTLQRLLPGGGTVRLPASLRHYRNLSSGPRGLLAATILSGARSDIWLFDEGSQALSRLTFSGFNVQPVWSPDGRWVAYGSSAGGPLNVYRRRTDGSGPPERLLTSRNHQFPLSWSADGRQLLLRDTSATTGADLQVLDLATRTVKPWLQTPARETSAVWSPDGRWVAYTSDETGQPEVYVGSYPAGPGRWQVSADGGEHPSWSADGRSLFFVRRNQLELGGQIWSVPMRPGADDPGAGVPRRVYDSRGLVTAAAGSGGLLLIEEESEPAAPRELRVVLEWASTLPAAPSR